MDPLTNFINSAAGKDSGTNTYSGKYRTVQQHDKQLIRFCIEDAPHYGAVARTSDITVPDNDTEYKNDSIAVKLPANLNRETVPARVVYRAVPLIYNIDYYTADLTIEKDAGTFIIVDNSSNGGNLNLQCNKLFEYMKYGNNNNTKDFIEADEVVTDVKFNLQFDSNISPWITGDSINDLRTGIGSSGSTYTLCRYDAKNNIWRIKSSDGFRKDIDFILNRVYKNNTCYEFIVKKNNTCSLNTFDIDRLEIFTEKSITQDI
jgi:hypothetical protein